MEIVTSGKRLAVEAFSTKRVFKIPQTQDEGKVHA